MEDVASRVGDFIVTQGPYVGAVGSLIFFFFELFLDHNRQGPRNWSDRARSAFLLLSAAGTTTFAIWTLQNEFQRKPDVVMAAEAISQTFERCAQRALGPALRDADRLALTTDLDRWAEEDRVWVARERIRYQCLALAIQRNAPSGAPETAPARLQQDVSLGELLLQGNSETEGTIPYTLRLLLGVDNTAFIGTGYSVPREEEAQYSDAALREYWAPNTCAEALSELCPERSTLTWAWRLPITEYTALTIRNVILDRPPEAGAAEWEIVKRRIESRDWLRAPLLIRFQTFPAERYRGTVGRPIAERVFFSSLEDSIDLSLSDAFLLSGESNLTDESAPNHTIFVWVHAPLNRNGYAIATWRNLFDTLRAQPVHPRLAEITSARNWPPES